MIRTDVIVSVFPSYLEGTGTTLILMGVSLVLGFLIAVPMAVLRVSQSRWLSTPVWLYTYVIRGTPLLVQLFIIYYGLAQFDAVRESIFWKLLSSAWFCACLAFVINTGAYSTEIFAGALKSIAPGEVEAAKSLGMSAFRLYQRILLPAALRRAIPAYSNEVVFILHATSLASAVTLFDLTSAARSAYADSYRPFEAFGLVAVFYLALTFTLVGLFKLAERRWLKHLRPRTAT